MAIIDYYTGERSMAPGYYCTNSGRLHGNLRLLRM